MKFLIQFLFSFGYLQAIWVLISQNVHHYQRIIRLRREPREMMGVR